MIKGVMMLYGFDVGGTKIAFSVYDQNLNCLFEDQVATPHEYDDFMAIISEVVSAADIKCASKGKVGLGIPGAINIEGLTTNCANVPAIKDRPLVSALSTLLDREIKLENDANCFLLSECFGGSADDCATVLGVTLGTGLGGAIFSNGKIITGKNSFSGEIGHFPIPSTVLKMHPELPHLKCGCGREMCLETYVSGTGLANLYKYYANIDIKGPAILDRYRSGEETAINVISVYFDILAAGIGTVMMILDADAIVFGGGLSKFETLTKEFSNRLPEHLLSDVQLPLIKTAKFGSEGGARGAALLNYVEANFN